MQGHGKTAVAGATGRVGRHVVDLLEAEGHDVVAMSRSTGVDVVTGDGLAEALAGVATIIDVSTPPTPDEEVATAFFTASARNLQVIGERAGVERIVVVSIIGIDRFTAGYYAAKLAQERAVLSGPIPVRILRAAQFHEFVPELVEWGRQGQVSYVQKMRTQLVAARTVAEALVNLADGSGPARGSSGPPFPEIAGPREESLVDAAKLLAARHGDAVRIEGVSDPAFPESHLFETDALLPGPNATLAGPTFEEWLESRNAHGRSHDVPGAVLVTSGLVLLVLGITQGRQWDWLSGQTVGVFAAAALLLPRSRSGNGGSVSRSFRFAIFRLRTLTGANVAMFIMGAAYIPLLLMLTLYMQQVLGYSPLRTGFGYLAVAGTAVIAANLAAPVVSRIGVKPVLISGLSLLMLGLLYVTQLPADGSYWTDLFPSLLIIGVAIPFAFVPIMIAALAGTKPQEAGLASGLINTSQQIGGALGIALLSTIAVSTTEDEVARGTATPAALTEGFVDAFWAGAVIAFVGVLVSVFVVRSRDLRRPEPAVVSTPALEEAA